MMDGVDIAEIKKYKREQRADKEAELKKADDAKDEEDDGFSEWKAEVERCAFVQIHRHVHRP